jgi:hypothetical protein
MYSTKRTVLPRFLEDTPELGLQMYAKG